MSSQHHLDGPEPKSRWPVPLASSSAGSTRAEPKSTLHYTCNCLRPYRSGSPARPPRRIQPDATPVPTVDRKHYHLYSLDAQTDEPPGLPHRAWVLPLGQLVLLLCPPESCRWQYPWGKDSLSESESEPEDTRCQAHLVLCAGPNGEASGFAPKRCWDRAPPAAARLIEEDACASGLGLTGSEPGTARLCHCHAKTYELEQVKLKCAYQACYQLGTVHVQGLTLCGEHARAHCRAEPDPQGNARGLPPPASTTRGGTVTPPDPDNPQPVGSGAGERHDESTTIGGAESHPNRWAAPSGSHPALNSISVRALVRGTSSAGHPAYFRFRAGTGRMLSPAGWASVHIPTLDWDLTVPRELYGRDPQEGDLTHSMQGAPVV